MTTDAEFEDDGPVLDPSLKVDHDEYVRRRRLKAINDAREAVTKYLPRSRVAQIEGRLTEQDRQLLLFDTVQSFIRTSRGVLRDLEEMEEIDGVMADMSMGQWRLSAPSNSASVVDVDGLKQCSVKGQTVTAHGLRAILESSSMYTVAWEVETQRHTRKNEVTTKVTRDTFPEDVATRAFDAAAEAMKAAGLNFQIRSDEEEYVGEYSDLIEVE